MTLLTTIKAKQLAARKNRATLEASLFTTLIGEASMPGKNDGNRESTDAEVTAVIKKFIKNCQSVLDITEEDTQISVKIEMRLLEALLPRQLSYDELSHIISAMMAEHALGEPPVQPLNRGHLMKCLKDKYAGLYDGKMASEIMVKVGL